MRKILPGKNSGHMLVSVVSRQDALSYQLRRAPVGSGRNTRKLDRATGRQNETFAAYPRQVTPIEAVPDVHLVSSVQEGVQSDLELTFTSVARPAVRTAP